MTILELPAHLSTASLSDVVEKAGLTRRVDRKYLVPAEIAHAMIGELSETHAVLQIDGRRSTTYRSTYFDTPTFTSTRSHVQRRRRRWKIRSRWYVEDNLCRIEVKTKNGRGETVKAIGPSSVERYGQLVGEEARFVEAALPDVVVDKLIPSAEVTYSRVTLADLDAGARVTIDWGFVASLQAGTTWLDEEYVLVETKGGPVPARADRVLGRLGARPRSFSKYAAASSLLHDDIADNDVRGLCGNSLHVRHNSAEGHFKFKGLS